MSDPHASAPHGDAAGHGDAHGHAPEPNELTHPLLWTVGLVAMSLFLVWLFFHELSSGGSAARGEPGVPELMRAEGGGVAEPDHAAFAKPTPDKLAELVDKGQAVFTANCATCHGPNGDLVGASFSGAPPRNFHTEPFKNPNGKGPYSLWLVVTNGFGNMPSFRNIDPVARYAVVHYVRETFVKKDNPSQYQDDPPSLQLPKPGGKAEGPTVPPNEVQPPAATATLMRATADEADARARDLAAWLDAAAARAAGDARADVERLRAAVGGRSGALGGALREAARADDKKRFIDLLVGGRVPGASNEFAVWPSERLTALFAAARSAAEGSR